MNSLDVLNLRKELNGSSIVLFGGMGFSGLNEEFNANQGIYRETINRELEIKESNKFENLYKFVVKSLADKNLVIATHIPLDCWTTEPVFKQNYTYISGHTHRNVFHDDSECRIYSDNQSGYNSKKVKLRNLLIDGNYEVFTDHADGVHEISAAQYEEYMRAKNIRGKAGSSIHKLYMVKREDYYCFVNENKNGGLSILNGGQKKMLPTKDVNYIYSNMIYVIKTLEKPLFKYKEYQESIANAVKLFGGEGSIHGCIIDIDFYNHLYVNPFDSTITPYFAFSITSKLVYPSIEELLKENQKELFNKYQKLLADTMLSSVITNFTPTVNEVEFNRDTTMYKASNQILKMQKLTNKTLTTWVEVDGNNLKIS